METMDRDGKVGMKVDSWWYVGEDGLPQDGTLGHQDILVSRHHWSGCLKDKKVSDSSNEGSEDLDMFVQVDVVDFSSSSYSTISSFKL